MEKDEITRFSAPFRVDERQSDRAQPHREAPAKREK
jgi:hypothetical protein